ncbi:MAG: hypothetical protein CM15mP127_09110 [Gammaproteobacteria bacterium]|nr:MAG: hypothetical protein CM15mP127_09110 [Gammaproteobacteria bacterium]
MQTGKLSLYILDTIDEFLVIFLKVSALKPNLVNFDLNHFKNSQRIPSTLLSSTNDLVLPLKCFSTTFSKSSICGLTIQSTSMTKNHHLAQQLLCLQVENYLNKGADVIKAFQTLLKTCLLNRFCGQIWEMIIQAQD